jgi:ParB/RepB/Spo0J family partition protein
VLNPRFRNKAKFNQIVTNIRNIGLKRPITVSRSSSNDGKRFDLVCGQGRLEAYVALGQEEIPAIIVKVSKEDCFLMSLVENLARRQQLSVELVQQIGLLKERGYTSAEIAAKIDVTKEYVRGIVRLLECGEERLISAVEKGQVPISTAVEISSVTDVIHQIQDLGGLVEKDGRTDLLTINGEFSTSIVVARCWQTSAGSLRWLIRFDLDLSPDITVALRMDAGNTVPIDYYLLPLIDMEINRLRLAEYNGAQLDTYRFDNLDFFFGMAERAKMWMAA